MRIFPIKAAALIIAAAAFTLTAATYKESGGRVVIEAEHFDARTANADGHRWQIVPDENGNPNSPADGGYANARGGKYMQSLPDAGVNYNSSPAVVAQDPHLDFKVQISNPGIYRLWVRWGGWDGASDSLYGQIVELKTPAGSGPDWYRYSLNDNYADFGNTPVIDGGAQIGWNGSGAIAPDVSGGPAGEIPAVWSIDTAGTYTIRLGMREDGSAVDALILQLQSLPDPAISPEPLESLIVGGADTVAPTLVSAATAGNPSGLLVVFSEGLSPATATDKSNYAINNGVTVNSAVLWGNDFTVLLSTTAIAPGQFYELTVNGVKDVAGNSLAANTKAQFLQVDGVIQRRVFDGTGGSVASLTNLPKFVQNLPDDVTYPNLLEGPVNYRDTYGTQFRGYVTAPVTGDYIFFISSDDPSNLFLSTDENPANRHLIANETAWSNSRQWQTSGGSSDLAAKRSDQSPNTTWPDGNTIRLTAGKRYYIEALQVEGGGGDNIAVTWKLPTDAAEPNDGDSPIPGKYLSVFGVTSGPAAIATPPGNQTAFEPVPATFSVVPGGTPPWTYQWLSNGVAIKGATRATYTTPTTRVADSGTKYSVAISNPFSTVTSAAATLTVISDTTPPVLYRAVGSATLNQVTLVFSEAVGAAATNLANFSIPGLTISRAILTSGGTNVVLTTSAQNTNTVYNVTVKDVKDLGPGLVVAPNPTTIKFTSWFLNKGGALQLYWTNITANNIAGLTNNARFPNEPSFTTLEPAFEYPLNGANEAGSTYGNQLIAYLSPPTTGDYVFFICSDDPSILYLSTDATPANKKLIAQETGWSNARQWTASGGGSDLSAKRSDQFALSEWPTPNQITLTAGKLYYMEALHTEGGGGDNVGVTWIKAGDADPVDVTTPAIPGANLYTFMNPDVITAKIAITSPADKATFAVGSSISFTVNASDSNGPIRTVEFIANGIKLGESTAAPYSFTWPNVPLGRYTVTANLLDRQGYTVVSAPITIAVGAVNPLALLITTAAPSAADNAVSDRLKSLGWDVVIKGDSASATADADGKDLIVISSTVGSGNVSTKFTASAVPIICWESALPDELGIEAGNVNGFTVGGQTDILIADAAHPLAAGFPVGARTVYSSPADVASLNTIVPSATVVATTADGATPVITAVEKGAALNTVRIATAPARRVQYYLVDTFLVTTDDGKKLFDAAVKWAANITPVAAQPRVSVTRSANTLTISWTPTGGTLQTTSSLSGTPVWTNVGTANPATITIGTSSAYYRVTNP